MSKRADVDVWLTFFLPRRWHATAWRLLLPRAHAPLSRAVLPLCLSDVILCCKNSTGNSPDPWMNMNTKPFRWWAFALAPGENSKKKRKVLA
jgi:hypothetical protein